MFDTQALDARAASLNISSHLSSYCIRTWHSIESYQTASCLYCEIRFACLYFILHIAPYILPILLIWKQNKTNKSSPYCTYSQMRCLLVEINQLLMRINSTSILISLHSCCELGKRWGEKENGRKHGDAPWHHDTFFFVTKERLKPKASARRRPWWQWNYKHDSLTIRIKKRVWKMQVYKRQKFHVY